MRAGRMDRRITIQQRVSSGKAANGEDTTTWQDVVADLPAEFVADRGQERFSAHQKQDLISAMFRIRYYAGLLAEMRIVCDGVNYDMTAVIPMRGRKTGLELMVTQGLTDG